MGDTYWGDSQRVKDHMDHIQSHQDFIKFQLRVNNEEYDMYYQLLVCVPCSCPKLGLARVNRNLA